MMENNSNIIEYNWSYPEIFEPVFDFTGRYVLLSGGRSSGKSWFVVHYLLEQAAAHKRDILCVRQYQTSITQSSHKLFKNIINKYRLPYTVTRDKITCNITGSEIVFIGMQDSTAESMKSYEDFHYCFVEEAQKLSVNAFIILNPTLRREDSQIFLAYNPLDRKDVAHHIRENYPEEYLHIHSTYIDNPFNSKTTLNQAKGYKKNSPERYEEVWLGKYPTRNTNKVCPDFSYEGNVRQLNYLPHHPLYITADFNISSQAWYVLHRDSNKYYFIDEFCEALDSGRMISMILDRYDHPGLIVINGDASGHSRKTSAIAGTDYDLIQNELIRRGYAEDNIKNRKAGWKKLYRFDVRKGNGSRKDRYYAWNWKLYNPQTGDRDILISPKCKNLIYNLEELALILGTEDFDIPSVSKINRDNQMIWLGHCFDSASYSVNYYHPIESIPSPVHHHNTVLDDWNAENRYDAKFI